MSMNEGSNETRKGQWKGQCAIEEGPWKYSVLTVEVEVMTFGAERGLASGCLWEVQP